MSWRGCSVASLVTDEASILANLAHAGHGLVGEAGLVTVSSEIYRGKMMFGKWSLRWSFRRKF